MEYVREVVGAFMRSGRAEYAVGIQRQDCVVEAGKSPHTCRRRISVESGHVRLSLREIPRISQHPAFYRGCLELRKSA